MAARYTGAMRPRQPRPVPRPEVPLIWLLSDARNDAALETALAGLPAGSGFVFRHYHLPPAERERRFRALAAAARGRGHTVLLAGEAAAARAWGADGIYGAVAAVRGGGDGLARVAAVHDGPGLARAAAAGARAVFLSPVFATRSHPGAAVLGIHGFHVLAQQSPIPVIALGGMNRDTARTLAWPRWGGIDAFALPHPA